MSKQKRKSNFKPPRSHRPNNNNNNNNNGYLSHETLEECASSQKETKQLGRGRGRGRADSEGNVTKN